MNRIEPLQNEAASGRTLELLETVRKGLGATPNLFRVTARSLPALEGMVGFFGAIARGKLGAKTREAIALAVAEVDGCDYCLSAHTALGKTAGLSDAEMDEARRGAGADPKIAAAARFARLLCEKRGHLNDLDLIEIRRAGYEDEQILEIIANVAWSVFTNYVNVVAGTEIDFPLVRHHQR